MKENSLMSVIDSYLKRGFGSMNKNDFEVFIFNELLKSKYNNGESNYSISIDLRIPESKVKRLRYEAGLRYVTNIAEEAKKDFLESLKKIQPENIDGSQIRFSIENISTRKYIDSILKKAGRFSDSSFNTEIVSLSVSNYKFLLKELQKIDIDSYLDDDIKKILKKRQREVSISGIFNVINNLAGSVFSQQIVDLSTQGVQKIIETVKNNEKLIQIKQ